MSAQRRAPARPKPSAPRPRPSAPRRAPRREEGLGGDQVEGRRSVLEALTARRRRVRRVVLAEAQEDAPMLDAIEQVARDQRVPVSFVSRARLDREARTEGHQGVYALCDPIPVRDLDALCDAGGRAPFLLVCDGIADPRNLGALLRSAECAGVTGVVLPKHRAARLTPAVTKTAAGAIEHLEFAAVGGIPTALRDLERRGVQAIGLAPEARRTLYDLDLRDTALALVIGSEASGLARLTRTRCAEVVSIPQAGRTESLNAAVAGAVACFEIARQRRTARGR